MCKVESQTLALTLLTNLKAALRGKPYLKVESDGMAEDLILELVGSESIMDSVAAKALEQVRSAREYIYPLSYEPLSVAEQVLFWQTHFPKLDDHPVEKLSSVKLPSEAESWAAIPKPLALAGDYCESTRLLMKLLGKHYGVGDYREDLDFPQTFLEKRTKKALDELQNVPGDFLVFPFQFGMRFKDHSVNRAEQSFLDNEFALGLYETIGLLLSHPERLGGLEILCSGCRYKSSTGGANIGHFTFYGFRPPPLKFHHYTESTRDNASYTAGLLSGFVVQAPVKTEKPRPKKSQRKGKRAET